jgi:hypothetical protein
MNDPFRYSAVVRYLNQFAKRLLEAYGKDPSVVPDWPDGQCDRIYIFRITDVDGKKDLTFSVEQQGLTDSLSDKCPAQWIGQGS